MHGPIKRTCQPHHAPNPSTGIDIRNFNLISGPIPKLLFKRTPDLETGTQYFSQLTGPILMVLEGFNEPLRAKGPLLVGEEVRKEDVGKVGS